MHGIMPRGRDQGSVLGSIRENNNFRDFKMHAEAQEPSKHRATPLLRTDGVTRPISSDAATAVQKRARLR